MLRFKILASVVPLAAFVLLARGELLPGPHPCIAAGEATVQIAAIPSVANLHVGFTDDPAAAAVRVQITDSAEAADFTVIDDVDDTERGACESSGVPELVTISSSPSADEPVIYLSQDGPADYRIFVHSKSFSAREAAALIVGAHGGHQRLHSAAL